MVTNDPPIVKGCSPFERNVVPAMRHSSVFSLDTGKENGVSWLSNGCASEVQAQTSKVLALASEGSVALGLGAHKTSNTLRCWRFMSC